MVPLPRTSPLESRPPRTRPGTLRQYRSGPADYQRCLDIAKEQTRDGAHLLDLCVDSVGRDGVADMTALASWLATASTLPIMLDSTETAVLQAGLEHLGGRCVINSVNCSSCGSATPFAARQ
nr:dihydropteroate synthase [Mycobacterium heckeshornense]